MGEETQLKRALGLGYTTFFGVGLILGAGIYVLVGRSAAFVGDALWLSVLFSTLIAIMTGFSYAELASMYPFASSTHRYVKEAFPRLDFLAFIAGWLIAFEGISGAATASVGFSRYFVALFDLGHSLIPWITIIVIIILSLINWYGIEESAQLTLAFTLVEAGGLILIVLFGFLFGKRSPNYLSINTGFDPITGILFGAAIFYFAFTGFELQPTLSEETKEAEKIIPKAIIAALLICSTLYLLVSLAVVRLLPWDVLAESKAPLADAAKEAFAQSYYLLMGIALFATSNTVLGFLVSSSRLIYGLASEGILYKKLTKVDRRRKTPYISVTLAGVIAILIVLLTVYLPEVTGWEVRVGGVEYRLIDLVSKTASLAALLAFVLVNISVIVLRYTKPNVPRHFKVPLSIGKFPVMSLIATILTTAFIVTSFLDWIIWVTTIIIVAIGLILYKVK